MGVYEKRINPLEISINENVSTREVKQKELYPTFKFGLGLENALLQYLHENHPEAYASAVAKLTH